MLKLAPCLVFSSLFGFTAAQAQTVPATPELLKDKISIRPGVSVTANEGKPMSIHCGCGPKKPEDQPIVLIDEKQSTLAGLRSLDLATIEEMDTSSDKKWIQVYGEQAKNGVIFVTLKKPATSIGPVQ